MKGRTPDCKLGYYDTFDHSFTFRLIVVINLLNRFVMFDVCACLRSAL